MPNQITADGLETKTQAEYIAEFQAAFESFYGSDINLDSDTPDGQMMMVFIQAVLDVLDLLTQVYSSFDPDNAIGVTLDQRCAINGIQRQGGTYTVTDVTVVVSQALTLYGLDQADNPVYTVADNEGNEWELIETQTPSGAGSYVYSFRSKVIGAVLTVPNTITVSVTIVLGVTSVNNPTTYTTLGLAQETDAALRIRRQRSVSISSQGYLAGLLAALENVSGVTSVNIYENTSDATDGDGVPGHSIWVIIAGAPEDEDIANAIYQHRNAGCGMFGDVDFTVTQADGTSFIVSWDVVELEDLYVKFTATSLDGVNPPNVAAIREQLVDLLQPGVYGQVNVNELATLVQDIDPNTLVTNAGFSLSYGGVYTDTLTPSTKKNRFSVSEANITILPVLLLPQTATIESGNEQQFTAYGGRGTYTYSISINNSGGSINATTGLYTAGATTGVVDTVHVVDSDSHTDTSLVTVL